MKAQILKIAGVKSEAEFYRKYPTEEAFFEAYPEAQMMRQGGEMIKRADGSYSRRGLWDNIRANKGSGKKPTAEMLEQERKIKANMQAGGMYLPEGYVNPDWTRQSQTEEADRALDAFVISAKGQKLMDDKLALEAKKKAFMAANPNANLESMRNQLIQQYGTMKDGDFFPNQAFLNQRGRVVPFQAADSDQYVVQYKKQVQGFDEGGENDREMVEGIANILAMVNDDQNRAMIGKQMLRDFEEEDVDYNYENFLNMAKLSKGKLPKAQVGLNLTPNQQSGYNWQNPFDQPDMNPFMPKQIIKKADGTTETRGGFGDGTMLFEQQTQGTPTAASSMYPITKKPKRDFFTGAYNRMMDQYTNPGSFMNVLNITGAAVNLATQGKRDRDFNSFLRERNASYNQAGNETIDRGNYSVNPSSYGLFQPQNMGVDSPEGQFSGGRFFSMQDGGSMDIAAKYTVPSIDAVVDSNIMTGFDFAPRAAAPDATFVNRPAPATLNAGFSGKIEDLPLDADAMLATIGRQESSSKPGQSALGLRTKLVGAGGKRGTASGTFQITDSTLKGIYNQHFDDKYNSFSQFKSAFNSNPDVEYSAAKALMNDHIKKYGIYALGAWYQPTFAARAAKGDMSVMGTIPAPEYGNRVTFGDYFNKSIKNYKKELGLPSGNVSTKPGVNLRSLNPNLMSFTTAMSDNFPGIKISSGNDSKHKKGSRHYENKAIDIGANSSDPVAYRKLKSFLSANPGVRQQYGIEDIIDEGDHLHVELFQDGGEYELTEAQIQQIRAMGGDVEFI